MVGLAYKTFCVAEKGGLTTRQLVAAVLSVLTIHVLSEPSLGRSGDEPLHLPGQSCVGYVAQPFSLEPLTIPNLSESFHERND